jgi:hypothetical protein
MCNTNPPTSNQHTPPARARRYARLLDHYRVSPAQQQGPTTGPLRFALVMVENQDQTSENSIATLATFEDACALAGEETLDSGRLPDAVYDLDTGQRIEVHTTTPVVTRSEDQGVMVNPLESERRSDTGDPDTGMGGGKR